MNSGSEEIDETQRSKEFEIRLLKRELTFKEIEIHLYKNELSSIYNTVLGQIIKIWKNRKKKREINHSYIDIHTNKLTIKFHTGALNDNRGIGRVSRELLKKLQLLQTENLSPTAKTVYFFSTIHHCPKNLPQPSCILIHDVTPIMYPELFWFESVKWYSEYMPIALKAKK